METKTKFTLTVLIVLVFMLGILGGLWADKNTREHCKDDLQYCVDKYNEDCKTTTNMIGMSRVNLSFGGDVEWEKENRSLT